MHGGGTRLGITTHNPPPARLLDVTRLVRRAGRALTGVDRVERAYLEHLGRAPEPLWCLARTSLGYVLIAPAQAAELLHKVDHGWGAPDLLSRLFRMPPARAGAEADLRRLAHARCIPGRLGRMLCAHLPPGTAYFNTGHSNFTQRVITAVRRIPQARISVLLHDTIPLDYPQYQRAGTPERFAGFLARVEQHADLVICNSAVTQADMQRHMRKPPASAIAHLGIDQPQPGTPPHGAWQIPYFVTIGTIEPRKNHALLLEIWAQMANPPDLLIIGARGWNNEAVFNALDSHPPHIHELPNLPDAQMFALLAGATGHLMPSHAEGYGLPPIEAAALGVPQICTDLPVYREVLKDIPVYLQADTGYLWQQTITAWTQDYHQSRNNQTGLRAKFTPPTWTDHFNIALRLT